MRSPLIASRRFRWSSTLAAAAVVTTVAAIVPTAAAEAKKPTPQATTVTAAVAAPSGQSMPVGDIPGWHQVFTDDFTTNVSLGYFPKAVSTKWAAYDNGWSDTSGNGEYYPSKVVSIQNGLMNLYLHTENGIHMVAAALPKVPGASGSAGGQTYGRYVVRFRADSLYGYKLSSLLWPDSDNWNEGEIDFPEGNLDHSIWAFTHFRNDPTHQNAFSTGVTFTNWHTAVTEWTPTSVKYQLDGVTIGTTTNTSVIPNTPMHWVMQSETSTEGFIPADSTAGNVQFDWVAVYTRA